MNSHSSLIKGTKEKPFLRIPSLIGGINMEKLYQLCAVMEHQSDNKLCNTKTVRKKGQRVGNKYFFIDESEYLENSNEKIKMT